jgi:chemosensory pili system protein ChpA (sensor histidine kinase/response regulator)
MRLEYEEVNKEVARLSVIEDAHKAAEAAAEAAAAEAVAAEAAAVEAAAVEAAAAEAAAAATIAEEESAKVGDAEIAAATTESDTTAVDAIVSSAPDTVVAPPLSPVDPVGDISQEVPVVEFPKPDDQPGTTKPTDNPFAWPPPTSGTPDADKAPADISSVAGVGSSAEDLDTTAGVGIGADLPEEDDLDEVSELISQTVSSFSDDPGAPSVLPELGNVAEVSDVETTMVAAGETSSIDSPPSVVDDLPDDSTQAVPQISAVPPSIFGTRSADDYNDPASAVRRQPGSRRRQIEIPSDILDDEVAVAQFVVSSPDVVLLVDGDSVAKLGWPSLLVAEQRDALVTYLADLSASSGAAPDVVFDGRIGDDDSLPASRAVRIRLSTPPTEPAAALDELVDAYPDQWPIALVTDDKSLADSASERGAAVLNNGQLLDLFIAQ